MTQPTALKLVASIVLKNAPYAIPDATSDSYQRVTVQDETLSMLFAEVILTKTA